MTKKKASKKVPKKAVKKGKVKRTNPPEEATMSSSFDAAMSRIAKVKWPPSKD